MFINGENWGVYINLQQYNKDFLAEQFGTKGGVRWKVGPGRGGALTYAGDDPTAYQETYQLKTNNVEAPWQGLIALCKMLDETTSDAELTENLPSLLNIDQVLWQLAVSNVFMDDDGYIHKVAITLSIKMLRVDSILYRMITTKASDSVERDAAVLAVEVRVVGHGGDLENGMASPIAHESNAARPLIHRLLSNPEWRARYLAHVRTVADEWLDWEVLGPIVNEYQELIDAEVQQDNKKLYDYQDFATRNTRRS